MNKKYIPYIALAIAIIFYIWVKSQQTGKRDNNERITINTANEPFDRNINSLIYSKHAKCRMDCRKIDESEVKEILAEGEIIYNRTEETEKGKSYALEGITHDQQNVRLVVAPKERELVVVTVID